MKPSRTSNASIRLPASSTRPVCQRSDHAPSVVDWSVPYACSPQAQAAIAQSCRHSARWSCPAPPRRSKIRVAGDAGTSRRALTSGGRHPRRWARLDTIIDLATHATALAVRSCSPEASTISATALRGERRSNEGVRDREYGRPPNSKPWAESAARECRAPRCRRLPRRAAESSRSPRHSPAAYRKLCASRAPWRACYPRRRGRHRCIPEGRPWLALSTRGGKSSEPGGGNNCVRAQAFRRSWLATPRGGACGGCMCRHTGPMSITAR